MTLDLATFTAPPGWHVEEGGTGEDRHVVVSKATAGSYCMAVVYASTAAGRDLEESFASEWARTALQTLAPVATPADGRPPGRLAARRHRRRALHGAGQAGGGAVARRGRRRAGRLDSGAVALVRHPRYVSRRSGHDSRHPRGAACRLGAGRGGATGAVTLLPPRECWCCRDAQGTAELGMVSRKGRIRSPPFVSVAREAARIAGRLFDRRGRIVATVSAWRL